MRVRTNGVLCFLTAWLCQRLRTPKSHLEGGGFGVQTLAWDVWAFEITAQDSHSKSWVLEGDETQTTGWICGF